MSFHGRKPRRTHGCASPPSVSCLSTRAHGTTARPRTRSCSTRRLAWFPSRATSRRRESSCRTLRCGTCSSRPQIPGPKRSKLSTCVRTDGVRPSTRLSRVTRWRPASRPGWVPSVRSVIVSPPSSLRVAMVCSQVPPVYGGAGTQALALGRALAGLGVEVDVLTLNQLKASRRNSRAGSRSCVRRGRRQCARSRSVSVRCSEPPRS